MPLLARKTFVPSQLPPDINPDAEVFTITETKEAFTSYEQFLTRYEQLRQPVWSCATTGKINLTYEQAQKSEAAASKQLQAFPSHFRRPSLALVHHSKRSLEPILDDVYEELHTRFAVGEPVEAALIPGGKQIDAVILAVHEPPTTVSRRAASRVACTSSHSRTLSSAVDATFSPEASSSIDGITKLCMDGVANGSSTLVECGASPVLRRSAAVSGSHGGPVASTNLSLTNNANGATADLCSGDDEDDVFAELNVNAKHIGLNGVGLSEPPKSADTSMEVVSAVQPKTPQEGGELAADPLLSAPTLVLNGAADGKADAVQVDAPATDGAAGDGSAAGTKADNEEESEEELEPSPTYSVQFSDGANTIKTDVDSDDITRLKRAPKRDSIRTYIKGCARRIRWKDGNNVWVVKDELVQELDLACQFPELTYTVVVNAMSPVRKRRSSMQSPGDKKAKRPKGPMKQMTLLDMTSSATPKKKPSDALMADAASKPRTSLGGEDVPQTPGRTPKKATTATPMAAEKSVEKSTSASKSGAKKSGRAAKSEQEKAAAKAKAKPPTPMSKANKMICDKIKNLDTVQDQPKGYVSRVLTQAARLLSTPERATLPPQQRKLVEEKIAQRLKLEELKKLTPEERKAKAEEDRKKKQEERRQLKMQQKLIEKESNRVREDEEVSHPKPLPALEAVTLPSGLANDSFGELAMVVEFLHVFQPVLVPSNSSQQLTGAGGLVQALVSGADGMAALSSVLMSLLKLVAADQGNRKELGLKISSMALMPETAPELMRLLLLPSHLLPSFKVAAAAMAKPSATDQAVAPVDDSAEAEDKPAGEAVEEMDAENTTSAKVENDQTGDKEKTETADAPSDNEKEDNSEEEDYEDEDLSAELVDILVRLSHTDFYDLQPNEKLQLLVALCGRVLSTTAIQDYQVEKRDAMRQLWRNRIEEGKEKKEKEEKEKQAKKDDQLKKQQKLMQNAMESFRVFKDKDSGTPPTSAGGSGGQTPTDIATATNSGENVADGMKEDDTVSIRRPATERQMERERQLAKDKERREREARELQAQREVEAREQRQQKFQNDLDSCKRAFRLVPLGFDRFRRRCWAFHPAVLPGLFVEDAWAPDMTEEVRTHGETTTQSTTSITITTASLTEPGSTGGVGGDVAMDAEDAKPPQAGSDMPSADGTLRRWRVIQSVPQFDEFTDALTATGVREKALKEVLEKQRSTLVSAIRKYSNNFLATTADDADPAQADADCEKSGELAKTNNVRESFKEDLIEVGQRLYRGGLGDPGDMELFQARVSTSDTLPDLRTLLLDVYGMINPRFTQGILCPPDIQETQLAMARAEGKEKNFKVVPCRLNEWKTAVLSAGTLSRLHLLESIMEECIQWHKSAENARCKICRKKSDDINMLLCDDCNQGFHLYCLRPVLHKIPSGHWACPSCQPFNARRSSRGVKYAENSDEEDEDEEEEEEDSDAEESGSDASEEEEEEEDAEEEDEASDANEDSCTTCGSGGDLLCCDTCPRVYHLECHVPPMRRAPRGKFVCYLCKNPRLAATRSRGKSAKALRGSHSRSASTSSKKSPSGRATRTRSRRAAPVESEDSDDDQADATEESVEESAEEEEVRPRRGRKRPPVQSSGEEESANDEESAEEESNDDGDDIEEASDNTDTETRQPARRSASNVSASKRRGSQRAVQSKGQKASKRASRAPAAKRRNIRQVSSSDDEVAAALSVSRRGGRDSHNFKEMEVIIGKLIAHDNGEPFALPVSLKDVPDYMEVVDEPMDFGTIRSRLKNMHYSDIDSVLQDVALVFQNCDAYNHSSTDTYKCGVKVERTFIKLVRSHLKTVLPRYVCVFN